MRKSHKLATFFHYTHRANERYGITNVHSLEPKILAEFRDKTSNIKHILKNIYIVKINKKEYTLCYSKNRGIITFLPDKCYGTFANPIYEDTRKKNNKQDIEISSQTKTQSIISDENKIELQKQIIFASRFILSDSDFSELKVKREILFKARNEIALHKFKTNLSFEEKIIEKAIDKELMILVKIIGQHHQSKKAIKELEKKLSNN